MLPFVGFHLLPLRRGAGDVDLAGAGRRPGPGEGGRDRRPRHRGGRRRVGRRHHPFTRRPCGRHRSGLRRPPGHRRPAGHDPGDRGPRPGAGADVVDHHRHDRRPVPRTLPELLEQALGGQSGCLVVEDDGATLFDHDSGSPFVPASTQKMLVAAAALSRLGPEYRFETKVVAPRPPQDGTLDDAWLVGGADSYLGTPDYAAYLAGKPRTADIPVTPLAALADELVSRGVRAIPAGLHPDESRYAPERS